MFIDHGSRNSRILNILVSVTDTRARQIACFVKTTSSNEICHGATFIFWFQFQDDWVFFSSYFKTIWDFRRFFTFLVDKHFVIYFMYFKFESMKESIISVVVMYQHTFKFLNLTNVWLFVKTSHRIGFRLKRIIGTYQCTLNYYNRPLFYPIYNSYAHP